MKRIDGATARLADAENALRDDDALVVDLPDTAVPAGRTVLDVKGLRITRDGRELIAEADLTVRGPERIALTGPNGAGKTTLLRALLGEIDTRRRHDPGVRRAGGLPVAAAGSAR